MNIVSLILTVLFSLFSSFVMSYIALATMIGPWMGPTLVVFGLVLSSFFKKITPVVLLPAVIGGALGGIIATCISFSFPTMYFLNKEFFVTWTQQPGIFIGTVAALCIVAGLFALWIVHYTKKELLDEQKLPFPIGKLVYDVAVSTENKSSKVQLLGGFLLTLVYGLSNVLMKTRLALYSGVVTVVRPFSIVYCSFPAVRFDMDVLPMFVSIGFIAGHMMTVPLLIGACARIGVVDLIRLTWFAAVPDADFMLAFCSGIVVFGAALTLIETPKKLWVFLTASRQQSHTSFSWKSLITWQACAALSAGIALLWHFEFSALSQVYILFFTAICTYQMIVIAGKIGLTLLGRFATFIMVPGVFLLQFTGLQATVVATFVELCGGIATELLFGLKTAQLAKYEEKEIVRYQLLGLIVGSIAVAVAFWFLVTHFELGSEQLFAQRAQGRALIIQAGNFDLKVLLLGAIFGSFLHYVKINSMLVLGGLLMSLSMVIPLVIGGTIAFFVDKKERFEPFCAGIYATNSLWMMITALWGK